MLLSHPAYNLCGVSDEGYQRYSGEYQSYNNLAPREFWINVHNSKVKVLELAIAYFDCEIIVRVVELGDVGDLEPGADAFLAVAAAFNCYSSGRQI